MLLHTMCTHIHRSHVAFVESIKNTIRLSTLQDHKDDVEQYLRHLQTNLRLISSTGESDKTNNNIIPHILLQLRYTKIPIFQQSVLKWHRGYLEGKLSLTPLTLVRMADEETQVLKHSQQWVDTIYPSVSALQAFITEQNTALRQILQQLTANLGYPQTKKYYHDRKQPISDHLCIKLVYPA